MTLLLKRWTNLSLKLHRVCSSYLLLISVRGGFATIWTEGFLGIVDIIMYILNFCVFERISEFGMVCLQWLIPV